MKKIILCIVVIYSSYSAIAQIGTSNFESYTSTEIATIEKQFSYDKLRLYPIRAKQSYHDAYKNVENFISIEEALNKGWLSISEISSSGRVNTLMAKNKSNYTIYGIAGEVLMGGKQDRILGDDVIIKPNEEKPISSFCVEHGRWQQKESGIQFKGYLNVTSNKIRKSAVVDKSQSKVWEEVDEVITKQKSNNRTQAYTALKNNAAFNETKLKYLNHFKDVWKNNKDVIGVVAVTGDKVVGCDIFATHQLFNNAYNNLLHAYVAEALTNGSSVSISYQEVQNYLQSFLGEKNPDKKAIENKGKVYEFENTKLHLSTF